MEKEKVRTIDLQKCEGSNGSVGILSAGISGVIPVPLGGEVSCRVTVELPSLDAWLAVAYLLRDAEGASACETEEGDYYLWAKFPPLWCCYHFDPQSGSKGEDRSDTIPFGRS